MTQVTDVLSCQLLTEQQTAKVMGCSVALLRKLRSVGGGPPFVKLGRLVRYSQADLVAFIEAKKERAVANEKHAEVEMEQERAA